MQNEEKVLFFIGIRMMFILIKYYQSDILCKYIVNVKKKLQMTSQKIILCFKGLFIQ